MGSRDLDEVRSSKSVGSECRGLLGVLNSFAHAATSLTSATSFAPLHVRHLAWLGSALSRGADWFDQNLITTYLGRLHRRLPMFQLPDVAVLLEAFANPHFRQGALFV